MVWLRNPNTGRNILKGGRTYNRLKKDGYDVDSFSRVRSRWTKQRKRSTSPRKRKVTKRKPSRRKAKSPRRNTRSTRKTPQRSSPRSVREDDQSFSVASGIMKADAEFTRGIGHVLFDPAKYGGKAIGALGVPGGAAISKAAGEAEKFGQWVASKEDPRSQSPILSEAYSPDIYKYIRESPEYFRRAARKSPEYFRRAAGKGRDYLETLESAAGKGADALQSGADALQSGAGYLQRGAEAAGRGKKILGRFSPSSSPRRVPSRR